MRFHLDGRSSVIKIDLQQLSSDQSRRDQYVRRRMFPNDPIAVFTLEDARPLPEGFTAGEVVTTQVTGQFSILGIEVPLIFEIETRDDGDVIFILRRTSFVWADFGMTIPISQSTTKTSVLVGSGIGRADRERAYFLAAVLTCPPRADPVIDS